jgi:hypothetical protein
MSSSVHWLRILAIISIAGMLPIPCYANKLLIFEGTVLRASPPQSPRLGCGVVAFRRLIVYRISRVVLGKYSNPEIIVDHLDCPELTADKIQIGQKLLVIVTPLKKVMDRTDYPGIREPGAKVDMFYLADISAEVIYTRKLH